MKTFVLDTSALLRLYVPDGPLPEGLEAALELTWRAEAVAFVPELALAEVAQVLLKKASAGFLTGAEADRILDGVLALPLEVIGHREILAPAIAAARRHAITVYDALFVALAHERGAALITADKRLAAVWKKR